jgi:hypothetical protein
MPRQNAHRQGDISQTAASEMRAIPRGPVAEVASFDELAYL